MEHERPHRTGGTSSSSELFICFTSRLSSSASSMKISSKSILSPGRPRDPPISLSTSLSRRLRTNGSIKGGQASPMFPTGGKKRGCAFENPEPSSPKVTCIGQVRVKSKKKQQGKKLRTLSRRHSTGEVSFRKLEQARDSAVSLSHSHSQRHGQNLGSSYHQQQGGNVVSINQETMPQRNQRWVHLPLTICEALRTFGSEFSCLFPCKSSCFSTSEREKEERAAARSGEGDAGQSSCGALFRWLVAMQDGEGGGKSGREIELVVGGDDDSEERTEFMERGGRNSRRHVFEDLEIVDNRVEGGGGGGRDQEAGRVSICVPPKNALLLMRCRSDPVKMEALTSKFWESPAAPMDDFDEEDEEVGRAEEDEEFNKCQVEEQKDEKIELFLVEVDECRQENAERQGDADVEANLEMGLKQSIEEENQQTRLEEEQEDVHKETELIQSCDEDESLFLDCLFEEFVGEEDDPAVFQEEKVQPEAATASSSCSSPVEEDGKEEEEGTLVEELTALEVEAKTSIEEKVTPQDCNLEDEIAQMVTHEESELQELEEPQGADGEKVGVVESEERESKSQMEEEEVERERESRRRSVLPDCLLLMMCEPKLSMEVSKETWVCSTDFIRRHSSERKKHQAVAVKPINEPIIKEADASDSVNKSNDPAVAAAYNVERIQHQAPRSSCSLPGMATMIEQKLVSAVGCEPFVLTRCKSEPMRKASQLVPETCFWKNRKLEPLRRAAYGVSAAGVGF